MAKRKKHRKKKHAKSAAVVTKPQSVSRHQSSEPVKEVKKAKPSKVEIAEAGSAKEASLVKTDVRYGLILVGIIVAVFVVLFILLQNPTVSTKIYGLIKLPNIGN